MVAYYEARAGEYDDWYLRRGRYNHGPIDDMAWRSDLDTAGRWLDELGLGGRIVELATGTGWWSPLLAGRGELWCYDAAEAPLELARQRLVAHDLRAHLHVRDAWAEPEFAADALFMGFWLSHVPRDRLAAFLALARRWLVPGGTIAFIDSRHDPSSSAHRPPPGARRDDRGADRSPTGGRSRSPRSSTPRPSSRRPSVPPGSRRPPSRPRPGSSCSARPAPEQRRRA